MLSQLGICSSRDTLLRLKTAVLSQRRSDGMHKDVATGAFSVTSIDNIDRAAPGKRVTPRNQSRGFHGTSVQHVAPMPLTCTLKENEVLSVPQSSVPRAGLFSLSFSALDSHVSARPRILKEGKAQNQKQDHPILVAPKLQFGKQSSYKLKT